MQKKIFILLSIYGLVSYNVYTAILIIFLLSHNNNVSHRYYQNIHKKKCIAI